MVQLEGGHSLGKVLFALLRLAALFAELQHAAASLEQLSAEVLHGAVVRRPVDLPVGEEVLQVVAALQVVVAAVSGDGGDGQG